ncbi:MULTISPECIES: hypothetical protein [unclassified Streptomyces]|uniref:hypothetical protein n=1 Tax=unclassified Streptomyces TaxID=2593676 RepID=UPI0013CF0CF9|nr:hypothetical protein [Streptomyces sp. Tu 4128]
MGGDEDLAESALDDGPGFFLALAVFAARSRRLFFQFLLFDDGGAILCAQPRRPLRDLPVGSEEFGAGGVKPSGHAESDFRVWDTTGEEAVQARRSGARVVRGRFAPVQGCSSFTGGLVVLHEGERSRCRTTPAAVTGYWYQAEP